MTRDEAITAIRSNWPDKRYPTLREALDIAIDALVGDSSALHATPTPAPTREREALENLMGMFDTAVWRRRLAKIGGVTELFYNEAIITGRAALASPVGETPAPDRIETCERCQMKLPEHLGTYGISMRAGTAWRCAACVPIEGPSGRLLREEVVRRRKLKIAGETPEGT